MKRIQTIGLIALTVVVATLAAPAVAQAQVDLLGLRDEEPASEQAAPGAHFRVVVDFKDGVIWVDADVQLGAAPRVEQRKVFDEVRKVFVAARALSRSMRHVVRQLVAPTDSRAHSTKRDSKDAKKC